jgi:hypothetical protein
MNPLSILAIVILAAGSLFAITVAVRTYLRYRGKSLVTCPETRKPVAVRVDAGKAALEALKGRPVHLGLEQCTRWPDRKNCGQECLSQIENDPERCRVWSIVQEWYRDRSCAYCAKPIEQIHWHDHRAALLGPDQKTLLWSDVPAEKLPEIFATYSPVCWSCHMAETFRREHPDRFVDRPWSRGAMGEYVVGEDKKQPAAPTAH